MRNLVVIKGTKSGIIIQIKEEGTYTDIESVLREKLKISKKFFGDATVNISFKGKHMTELEYSQLIDIIISETDLELAFIDYTDGETCLISNHPKHMLLTEIIKGTIRSGRKVVSDHNLLILGDVNPGAEVIAKGNIIVMGNVKGKLSAGSEADSDTFIAAVSLRPVQIKIGKHMGRCSESGFSLFTKKIKSYCEIAYVKDEMIHIDPIDINAMKNLVHI